MNPTPKTIQIYLPGGDPQGIRIAEITTRIVQVIEVPRSLVQDFLKMPESGQVALYFLFGNAEDRADPKVYIGQTGDHAGALTRRACFWSVQNLTEVFLDASPDAPLAVGPPAVAGPRRRVAPLGSDRARPARSLRPAGWRPVVRRGSSRPRAPLRPGPRRLGRVEA